MRRWFVGSARRPRLGFPQPLAETSELARQRIDLLPLCGNGLVQRLEGVVEERQPGFQRIDAVVSVFASFIGTGPVPRSRNPWPSGMAVVYQSGAERKGIAGSTCDVVTAHAGTHNRSSPLATRSSIRLFKMDTLVVMGPCFRRDDSR